MCDRARARHDPAPKRRVCAQLVRIAYQLGDVRGARGLDRHRRGEARLPEVAAADDLGGVGREHEVRLVGGKGECGVVDAISWVARGAVKAGETGGGGEDDEVAFFVLFLLLL